MKKFILFFIMLIISLGVKAQNFLELKSQEYRMASDSGKMKLDSIFCSLEKEWRDEQVKQIGGVAFGTSYDDAEIMFRNKFGKPVQSDRNKTLGFANVTYAGIQFDYLILDFESDGVKSYFNKCIFAKETESYSDACDLEKYLAEDVLKKYDLIKDEETGHAHGGGISPLWDGHWYNMDLKSYISAVYTDIINYTSKKKYAVRIMYGPYKYVNDEF